MPVASYYRGHGAEVLKAMTDRYGAKEGKKTFYATAQARHLTPKKVKRR